MRYILTLAAVILFAVPAYGWELEAMNNTINQTNFIVDNKCSGTLIDLQRRIILTNYHCVDSKIRVETREEPQPDGTVKKVKRVRLHDVSVSQRSYANYTQVGTSTFVATIVAHEKRQDLALLQLKAEKIPHTQAAPLLPDDVKMRRGERVYIVGNPAMLDATVGEGLISNLNRTFQFSWTDGQDTPMIQHSAGSYGGQSGGSLFNDYGFLIGVPSAGHRSATFIGLAIPITTVKTFMREHCFAQVFDMKADDAKCETDRQKKSGDTPDSSSSPDTHAEQQGFITAPLSGVDHSGKSDLRL